jgi:purine-cytosine permease-like protein
MNVGSAVHLDIIVAGRPADLDLEVSGLNLKGRRVQQNAHTVKPPWWHTAIAVVVSGLFPALGELVSGDYARYLRKTESIAVRVGTLLLLLFQPLIWFLTFKAIAVLYDELRLVL